MRISALSCFVALGLCIGPARGATPEYPFSLIIDVYAGTVVKGEYAQQKGIRRAIDALKKGGEPESLPFLHKVLDVKPSLLLPDDLNKQFDVDGETMVMKARIESGSGGRLQIRFSELPGYQGQDSLTIGLGEHRVLRLMTDKAPGEQLVTLIAIHTPPKQRELSGHSRFEQ